MNDLFIIKRFVTGAVCLLFFLKILDKKLPTKNKWIYGSVFVVLFTVVNSALLYIVDEPYQSVLLILSFSGLLSLMFRLYYKYSLTLFLISYAVSHLLYMVCTFIFSIIFVATIGYGAVMQYAIVALQLASAVIICKLRVRLSINRNSRFFGVAFFFFGIILSLYSVIRRDTPEETIFFISLALCLSAYGIYTIIRSHTITSFNDMAQKSKINEIVAECEELSGSHDFLEATVHKDKKSLAAIIDTLSLLMYETKDPATKRRLEELLNALHEQRKSQATEIEAYHNMSSYKLTGIQLLDSIVLHMGKRASKSGIELTIDFVVHPDMVLPFLSESQLTSLVADLLENAIIALEHRTTVDKKIALSVCYDPGNILEIVVKDNGDPFASEVLENFGKKKITTNKDSGGTGNGLKNICALMRKAKASFEITHYLDNGNDYTKVLVFRFDGKCEYAYYSA